MVDGDRVTLIDFQDLVWGFEIIDVVIACSAGMPHGDAFRAGYESVRAVAGCRSGNVGRARGRAHLNILNFGLRVRRPTLDEFVARHAEPVVAWMAPGASRA